MFLNVLITTSYMMNTEQAYVLRLQYIKELENLVEWVVILSASFTIMTKEVICDLHRLFCLLSGYDNSRSAQLDLVRYFDLRRCWT